MIESHPTPTRKTTHGVVAALLCLVLSAFGWAQQPVADAEKPRITAEQAQQLFSLIDELIKFSSQESGLPIQSTVKHQLTSRAAVESYLKRKFDEDQSTKRFESSEIVLKKFGLLDRDFELKPFLLSLLKEQIEAYYDPKTKSVFLLDWVNLDEQKPVLAHELTHALQDQRVGLEKWNDQTPEEVSKAWPEDTDHLARDEMDTAREAVVEGQATAVMTDYILRPMNKSLVRNPELMEKLRDQMSGGADSPILARAPLLLSESLLFPYRDGVSFIQDLWMDRGQATAFAGALDHPPTSSWEILNPRYYEQHRAPSVPLLPNIHPLVDKLYKPYDIGQVGQLDLHILATLFGGEHADRQLTPAWDGGIYWAGQSLSATTAAQQASTKSIAFFYLSAWTNEASARAFAKLYAANLGHKYSGVRPWAASDETAAPTKEAQTDAGAETPNAAGDREQIYSTSEGPVVIVTRGKRVFVAESFDLRLAHKLAALLLDAQGSGALEQAQIDPGFRQGTSNFGKGARGSGSWENDPLVPLSSSLIHFFADCGVMKAAVDGEIKASQAPAATKHDLTKPPSWPIPSISPAFPPPLPPPISPF
jgi:hypothetical protein